MKIVRAMLCLLLLPALSAAQTVDGPGPEDRDALISAMLKTHEAGSYRIRMSSEQEPEEAIMEFQQPDRFRVLTQETEMVSAGGEVYMITDGEMMQIPVNAGDLAQNFQFDEAIREVQDGMRITGVERVALNEGAATRYDFELDEPPSSNRAWVSSSTGYLIRVEQILGDAQDRNTVIMDYEDVGNVEVELPQ